MLGSSVPSTPTWQIIITKYYENLNLDHKLGEYLYLMQQNLKHQLLKAKNITSFWHISSTKGHIPRRPFSILLVLTTSASISSLQNLDIESGAVCECP